ncbi:MAG: D-aminoacyl-tRNA deacylase [candidate division WOR-3 bacterium]|nr:D-aminoacyl-tRNA deacylase [candidate division WOR-3 bacterium]
MRIVVQRVIKASVNTDSELYSSIGSGLLLLVCFEAGDCEMTISNAVRKISNLRIFEDSTGKMNLNITDISGEILAVSQFTLSADLTKGNRPSFDSSISKEDAKALYIRFIDEMNHNVQCQPGVFGEYMEVNLINDGPVTFYLEF